MTDTPAYSVNALLEGGWRDLQFEPFREGVEIHRICAGIPEVALLRYRPGASVPRHIHTGLETVLVLEGTQTDDQGTHSAGTFIINPEGTIHAVRSDTGCVVLIQWERPVRILEETT